MGLPITMMIKLCCRRPKFHFILSTKFHTSFYLLHLASLPPNFHFISPPKFHFILPATFSFITPKISLYFTPEISLHFTHEMALHFPLKFRFIDYHLLSFALFSPRNSRQKFILGPAYTPQCVLYPEI